MDVDHSGTVVLVTGGSGYVAGWLIVALLRQGFQVRATVRAAARADGVRRDVAAQLRRDAADASAGPDRLRFFSADLLHDGGWEAAADGADFVLHVATPMGAGDARMDIITPAREGTLRVLRAARKGGARRTVLTSSVMAAKPAFDAPSAAPSDETVWTDLDGKHVIQYARAKTLAERDAWAYAGAGGAGMDLATVLPTFILGPVLGRDFSASVELVERMLRGGMARLPRLGFSMVDVRDLADLHVRAMLAPQAGGQRFIGNSDFLWMSEVAEILRQRLGAGAAKVPPVRLAPDWLVRFAGLFNSDIRQMAPSLGRKLEFSPAKAQQMLGWRARPLADSVLDCAASLIREGLV